MKEYAKEFWEDEEGMGTVELVLIIAALIAVALLFKKQLTLFATNLMNNVFKINNGNSEEINASASEG